MRSKRILSLLLTFSMLVTMIPSFGMMSSADGATGPDYHIKNPYGTDPGDSEGLIPVSKITVKQDDEEKVSIPCVNLYVGFRNLYGVKEVPESELKDKLMAKGEIRRIWKLPPEKCVPHNTAECGVRVSRLYGLEYADKLMYLSLPYQRITDLEPLQGLTDLMFLNLRENQYEGSPNTTVWKGTERSQKPGDRINNLEPLSGLKKLEYLDIFGARPGDSIEVLGGLTNLRILAINSTDTGNLDFAGNLVNLKYLDASRNKIGSAEALATLKNLEVLKLGENNIKSISVVKNMPMLRFLDISSNRELSDISSLRGLENLEELFATNCNIKDFSVLKTLPRLSKVVVSNTAEQVSNSEKEFKIAKELYNKLNKKVFFKADATVIKELLEQTEGVKAFYSGAELDGYKASAESLKTRDEVENPAFYGENEILEIISDYESDLTLKVGDGTDKLPGLIEVKVKSLEGGVVSGKVILNPDNSETLKIAVTDSKGRLVTGSVDFVVEEEGVMGASPVQKQVKSDSAYLTLDVKDYSEGATVNIKLNGKRLLSFAQMENKLAVLKDLFGRTISDKAEFNKNLVLILPDEVSEENKEPAGEFKNIGNRDTIKLAITRDGKLVTEALQFKVGVDGAGEDSKTLYSSADGYLLLDKNAWLVFQKYNVEYEKKIVYQINAGMPGRIMSVKNKNGEYTLKKDDSADENRQFVIDLSHSMGDTGGNGGSTQPGEGGGGTNHGGGGNTPGSNVDESKIGFFNKTAHSVDVSFVVVDRDGKLIGEKLNLTTEANNDYTDPLKLNFKDGIYTARLNGAEASHKFVLKDDKYVLTDSTQRINDVYGKASVEKNSVKSTPDSEVKEHFIIRVKENTENGRRNRSDMYAASVPPSQGAPSEKTAAVKVKWNTDNFDTSKEGKFVLSGEIIAEGQIKNNNSYVARLNITVEKEKPVWVKSIKVRVLKDGSPLSDSEIRLSRMEMLGGNKIGNTIEKKKTGSDGTHTFNAAFKNTEYEVRMSDKRYKYDRDAVYFKTGSEGEIISVDGKPVKNEEDAVITFNAVEKNISINATEVKFRVIDDATKKPVKDVLLSSNTLSPSTGKYSDAKSDENGIVTFVLEAQPNEGKDYSICVNKNEQFRYTFKPEEITIKIIYSKEMEEFGMGYMVLEKKGDNFLPLSPGEMPTIYVTFNDRTALIQELRDEIKKAEKFIAENGFENNAEANNALKELKNTIKGAKEELAKDETIPHYVQGFIGELKKHSGILKKHVKAKPPIIPDKEPNNPGSSDGGSSSGSSDSGSYREYKEDESKNGGKNKQNDEVTIKNEDVPRSNPELKKYLTDNLNLGNSNLTDGKSDSEKKSEIPAFSDIEKSEYKDAIEKIVARGLMNGMSGSKFTPEASLTRAQLFTMFYRLSKDNSHEKVQEFKDVPQDAWYRKEAAWAKATGFSIGDENGNFKGEAPITNAEFSLVLSRFLEKHHVKMDGKAKTAYADEAEFKEWYAPAVKSLYSIGLITGERFDAGRKVLRGELANAFEKLFSYIENL